MLVTYCPTCEGYRNVTPEHRAYLIGKIYRETKKEYEGITEAGVSTLTSR